MSARVTSIVLEQLQEQVRVSAPEECCGILLGDGETVTAICPARNVHPQARTRFDIDPQALIDAHRAAREGGPQVMGYYHSHPAGPACPSATDEAMANGDASIWAIIGEQGDIAFWRDGERGFVALSLTTIHG